MRHLKKLAVSLAICIALSAVGQTPSANPATASVEFRYENPSLQPARYMILLHEDGNGRFQAETGPAAPDDIAALPAQGQERKIHISDAATKRIFSTARQKQLFATACENGGDKVAFQGKKTLTYAGPEGRGSCIYNYSKDQQIEWITNEFEGIASTLEEGRRLQLEHDHGRLTLDAELETLDTMAHNGQALELDNIAPTLQQIAGDDAVMQRVQKRARNLLLFQSKSAGK